MQAGADKKRVGITVEGGIPRHGMAIFDENDKQIGEVTSGTQSPITKAIGMAFVDKNYSKAGSTFFVDVRNKKCKATVVKTPFTEAHYFRVPA